MKSWKIGAVSGFIAGIVSSIVIGETFINIAISFGLYEPWYRPITTGNYFVNIPLNIFWAIIFGVIYSKVYNIIPKKRIWKGIIYGLSLYFITIFRIYFYVIPYGQYLNAAGDYFHGIFFFLIWGFVLGISYEFLSSRYYPIKEKKTIITYDMRSGLLPGAIAGLCGGMAASIFAVMGHVTGYWGIITAGEVISTIDFWMSQAGTHILINMIWGTIFGAFFAKVYNLVPGKNVRKGLYYALIMVFITSIYCNSWDSTWYAYHGQYETSLASFLINSISVANAIVYGLLLGLLYRKPTK